jgi:hypothetical protein
MEISLGAQLERLLDEQRMLVHEVFPPVTITESVGCHESGDHLPPVLRSVGRYLLSCAQAIMPYRTTMASYHHDPSPLTAQNEENDGKLASRSR